MDLIQLINTIMPRLQQILNKVNTDRLVSISVDEAWDNGILLTFQRYNGIECVEDDTYQMRAIVGSYRIIYETDTGIDFVDFLDEDAIPLEEYNNIMNF